MRWAPVLLCVLAAAAWGATLAEETAYPARRVRGGLLLRGLTARPVGMGEACTAVAGDAAAACVNPAGLGAIDGAEALVEYGVLGNGSGLTSAAGAMPLGPGTAGLSVLALMYGSYEVRNAAGDRTGTASATDIGVALGYAVRNPPWFLGRGSSGLALEIVSDAGGVLPGLSLGGVVPAGPALKLGFAAQHLGPRRDGGSLPALIRAGGMYEFRPGLSTAVDGGLSLATRRPWLAAGAEYEPVALLALRAGYKLRFGSDELGGLAGLGAGFGVRLGALGLDYAFEPFGNLALTHRISLSYAPPAARARAPGTTVPEASGANALSAGALYAESAALYAAGRNDEALAKATEAVRTEPGHWQAWQMVGNCQYAKGDRAGALASWRRSLDLNPANSQLKVFVDQLPKP